MTFAFIECYLPLGLVPARLFLEDREDVFFAHDEVLFAVDLDVRTAVLAEQDAVALLDGQRRRTLPSFETAPGPAATTSPSAGFSLAESGMMMPPLVFSSSATRLTSTRSWSGRIFMAHCLRRRSFMA